MAAQEERTSSLIPTRDALALEAAELRKFTPTKPLAEIKDEIKTEVAARRKKEGEVRRVKEKITTINARAAPRLAEMCAAARRDAVGGQDARLRGDHGAAERAAHQADGRERRTAGLAPFVILLCLVAYLFLANTLTHNDNH